MNFYIRNNPNNKLGHSRIYKIRMTEANREDCPAIITIPNPTTARAKSHKTTYPANHLRANNFRKNTNCSLRKHSTQHSGALPDELAVGIPPVFDPECWRIDISIICGCLHELCETGLDIKKVNKLCHSYFANKTKGISELFMNCWPKKKSLNDELTHSAVRDEGKLMARVKQLQSDISEKEKHFLGIEIAMYRNFLE
jgi:hypothetical protein